MGTFRKWVVFDFETDGKNPEICNPVEVGAIVIDPRNLNPIRDAEFCIDMRPPGIDDIDTYLATKTGYKDSDTAGETVKWHAKQNDCTEEAIIEKWKGAPDQQFAWRRFSDFINKFNYKKTMWFAPIACGMNITGFDIPIAQRLNTQYGIKTMFWPRDIIDLQALCFYWFESISNPPKNYKLDTLREYFGMEGGGAHNAIPDCKDTGELIRRFMKIHRSMANRIKFKGACKKCLD